MLVVAGLVVGGLAEGIRNKALRVAVPTAVATAGIVAFLPYSCLLVLVGVELAVHG